MTQDKKTEVWIFYSTIAESGLLKFYAEGIAYLHEINVKTHVINVNERPEIAEKYKIMTTPVLLIKSNGASREYVGIVDGLKTLLTHDLHGKSILHVLGFKEGRAIAKKLGLPKKKKKIEEILRENLSSKGIHNFQLIEFDIKKKYAKVRLKSEIPEEHGKSKTPVCFELCTFLGGIFMEIFGKGMEFKETQCMAQGHNYCEFEIQKPTIHKRIEKEISEKFKKWE